MSENEIIRKEQYKVTITEKELCAHIEDDDFWEKHKSPVLVEGENGDNIVMMEWSQCQAYLRELELLKKASRPGYDPSKECELRITMDEELYKELEIICFQNRMTVAGATERFLEWFAKHPEEARQWVEKCRAEGLMEPDERFKAEAVWI